MIARFFSAMWNAVSGELVRIRWALMAVLGATILGAVLILVFSPSVGVSVWITLIPWLFTAYRLYSVQRLINVHITGEGSELLMALSNELKKLRGRPVENQEETGVFDNEFIRAYFSVISNIFLVQTALFLVLPLYVNYTVGGITTAIIIAMLMVVIAIDNFTSLKKMSRFTVKIAVIAYAVGLVFVLFPHVGFYFDGLIGSKINVISASTAKKVNDLAVIQKKQQEQIDNEFVDGIIAWQKANPGAKLPKEYEEALNRGRKLELLKSSS